MEAVMFKYDLNAMQLVAWVIKDGPSLFTSSWRVMLITSAMQSGKTLSHVYVISYTSMVFQRILHEVSDLHV